MAAATALILPASNGKGSSVGPNHASCILHQVLQVEVRDALADGAQTSSLYASIAACREVGSAAAASAAWSAPRVLTLTFGASFRAALAVAADVTGVVPVAAIAGRAVMRVCAVASWLDHVRKSPVGRKVEADEAEPMPSLAVCFLFGLDMMTVR